MLKVLIFPFLLISLSDLLSGMVHPLYLLLVLVDQLHVQHVVLLAIRVCGVDKGLVGLHLGSLRLLLGAATEVKHLYESIKIQYYYRDG